MYDYNVILENKAMYNNPIMVPPVKIGQVSLVLDEIDFTLNYIQDRLDKFIKVLHPALGPGGLNMNVKTNEVYPSISPLDGRLTDMLRRIKTITTHIDNVIERCEL